MTALIALGLAMAVVGLIGLGWCMRAAAALRRSKTSAEETRRRLTRLVAVNMAAFGIAFLGLGLMLAGFLL